MTAHELHLQALVDKLKNENEIIKRIATSAGFYQYYFENLKHYKTEIDCFEKINDLYYEFFGEHKFSSYDSFRKQKNKYITK